ncbi:MAG TPA: DUF5107 domain-containing protein [Verrucomicrobiae bacterium]
MRPEPISRRPVASFSSAAVCCVLAMLCAGAVSVRAASKVTAYKGQIELPTYPWAAVKHPYFRGTDGVNIYPYPMLDFLSRDKTNRTYQTVVLENEYLKITFLPELGGKIHEVIDKSVGKPMFYVNHVVKPGLIGQCGAWTSGGVEWNTGPQGHTVGCMQPVAVLILPPGNDGSQSVAVGETERIYGTRWTVVVTLRPGRSFIEERVRIYNPTETIRPYYFWNCTAAPNTPGFRFIYPMTLGCDHAGEKFFKWPIDNGKDLSRGTNYQDASSIFAWHCDQDFFGSYNDDLDHGAVSYANHHQLPGKKAWTWGYGGFGTMHQRDLTDNDGPYNEVQTGPLLTQAQVGRLDPCEAVEWNEWWYPIHGTEGFTFANRNLAVNVTRGGEGVRLRLLGTATWSEVRVRVLKGERELAAAVCKVSPKAPTDLRLGTTEEAPLRLEIATTSEALASFPVPLDLPLRTPPEHKPSGPTTASEFVQAGWEHYLFARFAEAEKQFRKALDKDATNPEAHIGLAHLNLDRDPAVAAAEARSALLVNADNGRANYVLGVAEARLGHERVALESAWKACLEPEVAIAARALAAKMLIRMRNYSDAIAALSEAGPWREDPVCRARLALSELKSYERGVALKQPKKFVREALTRAADLAQANLAVDPLDSLSRNIRFRTGIDPASKRFALALPVGSRQEILELLAQYSDLGHEADGAWVFPEIRATLAERSKPNPLEYYWLASLPTGAQGPDGGSKTGEEWRGQAARNADMPGVFPYQLEFVSVLRAATEADPQDGKAALYLGHLLFHLGRHAEARKLWQRAAELGAEPVIAYRALGMAAKTLDSDLTRAHEWLEKAYKADSTDAIVARDLAKVLFEMADKADSDPSKRELLAQVRDRLKAAFEQGKGRSDFVALLARAQNRLGEYAESARMLDTVRVTVWEGSHEVHDLFEQAHLALGEARLKEGKAAEGLKEFDRALEYPANLATGKLENARAAHIQYQRGNALAALGRKEEARAAWKLAADEPESKDSRIEEARGKAIEALRNSP